VPGLSLAIVSRVIKLKQDTRSVSLKRKGKCGRKKKTTPETTLTYSEKVKKIPCHERNVEYLFEGEG